MKRLIITLFALTPFINMAQTIVSTEPQNKNVVLEKYTGVNCGYCPDGTIVAHQIYNANPDRVVIIEVHAGSFANPSAGQPDFRTPFGAGLLGQTGITGFPAGTVNRHVFPGYEMTPGKTGMGRDKWTAASNTILNQPSYVNVGATSEIDMLNRTITVYVEAYYTESSPLSTNKINVVLLQDKTYGFQSGGGANYEHNNRLIHMITGQWGEEISETSRYSLYTNTFTYNIPEHLNQIPIELNNLKVAVFVAENNQEIISGVQVKPSLENIPEFEYQIVGHSIAPDIWEGKVTPKFVVKSLGLNVTSLDIEYNVNNQQVQTYTWNGTSQYGENIQIELPEIIFEVQETNVLTINITNEDNSPNNNSLTVNMQLAPLSPINDLVLEVKTDNYGNETTWKIKNSNGALIANGGPYPANNSNIKLHDIFLEDGFYSLEVYDTYGDGIISNGYVRLKSSENTVINIPGSTIGSFIARKFRVENNVVINFDPVDGATNVSGNGPFTIESDKKLYTSEMIPIDEDFVYLAIELNKNNSTGSMIPYTATVTEQRKIEIVPDYQIENGAVVYLSINAKNEDNITIKKTIHFTINNTVGISENNYSNISLYPNPAKDSFTIANVKTGEVSIYSLNGQLVLTQTIHSTNQNIKLTNGLHGVYMVKIQTNDTVIVKPLIITE